MKEKLPSVLFFHKNPTPSSIIDLGIAILDSWYSCLESGWKDTVKLFFKQIAEILLNEIVGIPGTSISSSRSWKKYEDYIKDGQITLVEIHCNLFSYQT
ncbi:hypothetical protein AQUCO_00400013v1 [Aquilegia coerulea]|uniref:Uncharacterized protein n=1 Tax=Aquilegia coerulea TaxID=218851 RepID=A0A2G5ESZ0_AQUCA|nr:hypothetical protein AQUCO_00400013v1 [Aquilegia coerulea]